MWYKLDEYRQVIRCEIQDYREKRWGLKAYIGNYLVSTVFLGLDHGYDDGPPVVFETMIFPSGTWDETYMTRCCTYPQALWMHLKGVMFAIKRSVIDFLKEELCI